MERYGHSIKDIVKVYLSLLPKHWYVIYIFLFTYFTITVSSQPLHLPPESFKCGPPSLNFSCERWGYQACITDDEESYCFPCYNEYLTSLCGTQEENPGCNLYCTQEATDKEIQKTRENFTEQLEYKSQEADLSKTEIKQLSERIKNVERSLRKRTSEFTATLVSLCITVAILFIFSSIVCIRSKLNKKGKFDHENPDQDHRSTSASLIKDTHSYTETEISDETEPKELSIIPDSIEHLKISYDSQHETTSNEDESEDVSQNKKTGCKAANALKSIPATNTRGNNKFAINKFDATHSKASS